MAYTLIVNPGSTSRKYALYAGTECRYTVLYEDTGNGYRMCAVASGACDRDVAVDASAYQNAITHALGHMIAQGVLRAVTEVMAVGVRVVAPVPQVRQHATIDEAYLAALTAAAPYAPRHIPPLLNEIHACQEQLPNATLVAVSDSAFHTTIPVESRTISVAAADAKQYALERYGYHGLSVASIVRRVAQVVRTVPPRLIVCHIGGGISVTAVRDGHSVAT